MLHALVAADVRFVLVGGLAMRALGSAHITDDLDICYDASPENLTRLADLLASWRAELRGAPPGLPFTVDVRQFQITPIMTLATVHGAIDVMDEVRGIGGYAAVDRAAIALPVGGVDVRVLDVPGLIRAKKAVGRRKDQIHLAELQAMLELRRGPQATD